MSFFETAREIVAHTYRCAECKRECVLNELNQDMLCEACGEPDEEEDYAPTEGELRRDGSTWSV